MMYSFMMNFIDKTDRTSFIKIAEVLSQNLDNDKLFTELKDNGFFDLEIEGNFLLSYICFDENTNKNLIKKLIDIGIDINKQDNTKYRYSAFFSICQKCDIDLVKYAFKNQTPNIYIETRKLNCLILSLKNDNFETIVPYLINEQKMDINWSNEHYPNILWCIIEYHNQKYITKEEMYKRLKLALLLGRLLVDLNLIFLYIIFYTIK